MKKIGLVVLTTLILSVAIANAAGMNHNASNEDDRLKDDRSIKEMYQKDKFKEEKNREEKAKKEKSKEENSKEMTTKKEEAKEEKVKEKKAKGEKSVKDLISCKSSDGCGLDINNGIDDLVKPHKDEDIKSVDGHCNESSTSLCQINHDNKLSSIPEPTTYALFAVGAAGLISFVRRQAKKKNMSGEIN